MHNRFFIVEPSDEIWSHVRKLGAPLSVTEPDEPIQNIWARLPLQDSEDHFDDVVARKGAGAARIVFSSSGSGGRTKYTLLRISEVLENAAAHGRGYRALKKDEFFLLRKNPKKQ